MNGLHKDLPNRKSIRLNGYDYSQNGLYFITFCIHNKNCYLGKITGNIALDGSTDYSLVLSGTGEIVKSILETASDRFENIKLDAYCIMPNHVHMVLTVIDDTLVSGKADKRSLVSKIVGYIKMNTAKQIRLDNPFIPGIWQWGYHGRFTNRPRQGHLVIITGNLLDPAITGKSSIPTLRKVFA